MNDKDAICVLECIAIDLTGCLAGLSSNEPMADVLKQRINAINAAQVALQDRIDREKSEPLSIKKLREMDGEPVWVYSGDGFDLICCALVEVGEESVWLTNNLGGRTEYADDVEIENDGIAVYRRPLKPAMPGEDTHEPC